MYHDACVALWAATGREEYFASECDVNNFQQRATDY